MESRFCQNMCYNPPSPCNLPCNRFRKRTDFALLPPRAHDEPISFQHKTQILFALCMPMLTLCMTSGRQKQETRIDVLAEINNPTAPVEVQLGLIHTRPFNNSAFPSDSVIGECLAD